MLDDAVATQDTVTQLIAAIRRVAREVPGAAEVIAAQCTGARLHRAGQAGDRLERPRRPGAAGRCPGRRCAPAARAPARAGTRARRGRGGRAAGAGRRAGRRTRRGLRWHRRTLAHRAEGGPGAGDLHRGSRGPARAQDPRPPPGRLQGAREGRAGHRADHRVRADPGRRAGALRRRGRYRAAGRASPTRSRCWAIRPTAPASCWPRPPTAGTPRSSSRGRCARPWTAGSPSTSSPSTRPPAR